MSKKWNQPEIEAAYETPIERYAREGTLQSGCLHGASYQRRGGPNGPVVKDANGNPILLIKCGKLCDPGQRFCPKHTALEAAKELKKR